MSYEHPNGDFQMAKDLYPGEEWCNNKIPHPKWHIQTAIALLDLVRIVDDIDKMFEKAIAASSNS